MRIWYNGNNYTPKHFKMLLEIKGDELENMLFDKFIYVCNAYGWNFDTEEKGFPWDENSMFLVNEMAKMYDNLVTV